MAACSSSPAPAKPCNEDPWQCAAGQTCWPQSCSCASGWQFSCVASAQGIPLGESCTLDLGKVQCGDMQTCVAFEDAGTGFCRAYCDPSNVARGCASGQECTQLFVGNASPPRAEYVCVPIPTMEDASLGVDGNTSSSSGGGLIDVIVQPDVEADNVNTHQ
jgi:hypothetical protein